MKTKQNNMISTLRKLRERVTTFVSWEKWPKKAGAYPTRKLIQRGKKNQSGVGYGVILQIQQSKTKKCILVYKYIITGYFFVIYSNLK
jgi:hypothetical protein